MNTVARCSECFQVLEPCQPVMDENFRFYNGFHVCQKHPRADVFIQLPLFELEDSMPGIAPGNALDSSATHHLTES